MNIESLAKDIQCSWCAETSNSPKWSPSNPALGQSAATALLVQYFLEGEIWRGVLRNRTSHYWNSFGLYGVIDLTLKQFETYPDITEVISIERDHLMAHAETKERYAILKYRMYTGRK